MTSTPPLTPLTATRDNPMPIDALGERIAELAARIHAATYEMLVMLREYDEGGGWNNGFLSCANWQIARADYVNQSAFCGGVTGPYVRPRSLSHVKCPRPWHWPPAHASALTK